MRGLNIGGAAIVLLANLYVSFNHTLDLFQSAGFVGDEAVVATIGAEAGFLVGVVNLVVARFKGIRPSWPAKASGALGLFLVGWSNVAAGWPYGLVGVALGLYIPAMMFTTEANLGWSLSNKPTTNQTTSKKQTKTKATNQDQPTTKEVGREDKPTIATSGREAASWIYYQLSTGGDSNQKAPIKPDAMLGIKGQWFLVEYDTGTETTVRLSEKFTKYLTLSQTLGMDLPLLFVTTSEKRVHTAEWTFRRAWENHDAKWDKVFFMKEGEEVEFLRDFGKE